MLGYFGTVPSYVHHHSSEVARWGRDQIYPDIIWLEFVLDPMMLPLFCLWSLNPYWFIPMFLNGHFFRPIPLNPWVSWKHGGFLGDTPKSSRSLDHLSLETYGWLVVSTYLPLRKIFLWKSVGMMTFPIFLWEVIQNSMVPNHQPDGILGIPHPEPPFHHRPGGHSSGCSSSSSARPSFPPRAVRPTRCTYCCRLLGAVIWTTKVTWSWGRHEKWKRCTMKHDEQWEFTMKRAGLHPVKRYYIKISYETYDNFSNEDWTFTKKKLALNHQSMRIHHKRIEI